MNCAVSCGGGIMSIQKTDTLQDNSVLDEVYPPVFVLLPDNIIFEDLSLEIWQRLFSLGILGDDSPVYADMRVVDANLNNILFVFK